MTGDSLCPYQSVFNLDRTNQEESTSPKQRISLGVSSAESYSSPEESFHNISGTDGTPATTGFNYDGNLRQSRSPTAPIVDVSPESLPPPTARYYGFPSAIPPQRSNDNFQALNPDFLDWVDHPTPVVHFKYQLSQTMQPPLFTPQFTDVSPSKKLDAAFLPLATPPQALQHNHFPQPVHWPQLPAFVSSTKLVYRPFPYELPYQPMTATINPQVLLPEGINTSDVEALDKKQRASMPPEKPGKADTTASPNPKTPPPARLSSLPASIADYGFEWQDFDPMTQYISTLARKDKYEPFPPDLSEEHIFNADPKQIAYDNLLRIATKYSNGQILKKINEGRPEVVLKSVQVVESRVRAALTWKAEKEDTDGGVEAVRRWFEQERAKNGIAHTGYKRAH